MAIYDRNATASSAVTAFLAQFTISANGNIRYSTGSDTFHVTWLHRALSKIAYDFSISGDDEINLTKPRPSTSEALGTIITLIDHTTDYSTNYNIDDTVAEYLFGGSVEQNNGDDGYYGLNVLGSVASATELQIIQNNTLLTSHWGTGKNQTDTSTLLRVLIKGRESGSDIDGKRVIVKANEWGDTYAVWRTKLGLGESVAAINTSTDPQNDSLAATVGAYTGITSTEGYVNIDVGTGGDKPYYIEWDRGTNTRKQLYEYAKYELRRGSTSTVFGIDGDLFTGGPTFKVDVTGASGTSLVQNEVLTWTADSQSSSGVLMAADDLAQASTTEIWVHLLTGVNPTSGITLTGANATVTTDAAATNLMPFANHLGFFTGNAWIGAYGVGFDAQEVSEDDTLNPLDDSGPINPPNRVTVSVTVDGATNAHVFLSEATNGVINQTQYTAAAGNNSGDSDFVINEIIEADTPEEGYLLVKEGTTFEPLEYTSWTGSTFTLASTLGSNYTSGNDIIVPILYHNVATDGGSATATLVQSTDISVSGWVRHGEPSAPSRPVAISGTIGETGLNLTVQLEDE